jgi:hypothetical protein
LTERLIYVLVVGQADDEPGPTGRPASGYAAGDRRV